MCPTSNLATGVVASYDEHPLRTMVEAGLYVTINSDDPHFFGTTLCREYEIAADLLGLDEQGIAQLARGRGLGLVPGRRRTSHGWAPRSTTTPSSTSGLSAAAAVLALSSVAFSPSRPPPITGFMSAWASSGRTSVE